MKINFKPNEFLSNKNSINKYLKMNQNCEEEEEEDLMDSNEFRQLCSQFVQFPSEYFSKMYFISNYMRNADSSLISFLLQIGFFEAYTKCMNDIEETNGILFPLQTFLNFTYLKSSVKMALINSGCLNFLKKNMFSTDYNIQCLSLKCLKNLSLEDKEIKTILVKNALILVDFYSMIIGCKNDRIKFKISKLISILLSNDIENIDILLVRKIAFELMKYHYAIDQVCRILCYTATQPDGPDPQIYDQKNASILVQYISYAKESKFLSHLLKFFTIRAEYKEEAYSFYNAEIVTILENFIKGGNSEISTWASYVFENIIKQVPESNKMFFDLDFFNFYSNSLMEGSYQEAAIAIAIFSRVVKNCHKGDTTTLLIFLPAIEKAIELIEGHNTRIIGRSLDMILIMLSTESPLLLEKLRDEATYLLIDSLTSNNDQYIAYLAQQIISIINPNNFQ